VPAVRKALAFLLVAGLVTGCGCGSGGGMQAAAPARAPAAAKVPRRPPVVFLVMDEFPTDALLGPDRRIDATRFPNFAELARISTWFPNSTTVYDSTPKAVPLILDGRKPFLGEAADTRDHRHSIFTALGRRGYRITDSEEATAICPRRYCRHARSRRPAIIPHLVRGRPDRFRSWVRSIKPGGRPGLWVKHLLLPHQPWLYLPSGKQMRPSVTDPVPGMASPPGFYDRFLTDHNRERQYLQIGFTDRELGLLLRRLRSTGMLDKALVVVTADHGYAWEVGVKDRRKVTPGNVDEIAPQPLFIKAPGQAKGRIDRSYVRTLDITPTIADILNIPLGYRADGRSAFSRVTRRRRYVRLPTRDFKRIVRISARGLERRRRVQRKRWLRFFGAGSRSVLLYGNPWASVYRIGPHRGLIGRTVAGLHPAAAGRVRARIANARLSRRVRTSSSVVPTQIGGRIAHGRRGAERDVAVAVNGRIEAVGRSFHLRGSRTEGFSTLVPETAMHAGANDVRVYQVSHGGRLTLLGRN
jgi:hypothetical protein